jgi:hypothetical protein
MVNISEGVRNWIWDDTVKEAKEPTNLKADRSNLLDAGPVDAWSMDKNESGGDLLKSLEHFNRVLSESSVIDRSMWSGLFCDVESFMDENGSDDRIQVICSFLVSGIEQSEVFAILAIPTSVFVLRIGTWINQKW